MSEPDILTRKEAAALLRVSEGRLRTGWGPKPLPQYRPSIRYLREEIEAFKRQHQCDGSTNPQAPATGGTASSTAGRHTAEQQERLIAAKLRASLGASKPKPSPAGPATNTADEERA